MSAIRRKIDKAMLAGYEWGARTADIVAALWPESVEALVSVSGYLIGSQEAGKQPLAPAAELQWWYQFYFHNLPQEAPKAFAQAVLDAGKL